MPDEDVSLSDMVRDLQESGVGDQNRLSYVMSRIENGRTIYDSDRRYVEQKFRQLRDSITGRDEETQNSSTPVDDPVAQDAKDSKKDTPNEPSGFGRDSPTVQESRRRSSRAWYLLPIFLGVLGGIMAYAKLRKKDKGKAYKTLGLGIGLTVMLTALMFVAAGPGILDDFGTTASKPLDVAEKQKIKSSALSVPYDALMADDTKHAGDIVHDEGKIVQVRKDFGNNYVLRIEVGQELFVSKDVVWVNYSATSDEEAEWLGEIAARPLVFGEEREEEWVKFWGVSKGIKEYEGRLGQTISLPEVDGLILERSVPDDAVAETTQSTQPPPPTPSHMDAEPTGTDGVFLPFSAVTHTISHDDIPEYADDFSTKQAFFDAVASWSDASPGIQFDVVSEDADVNIEWKRFIQGPTLGLHKAFTLENGTITKHAIDIRLGIDDCHSDYQLFAADSLKHTIAHEMGHYLGLRHVDDDTHLMYSGGIFDVDPARVYDTEGLVVPNLDRPEIRTVQGQAVQSEIDTLNMIIDDITAQRQTIKESYEEGTQEYERLLSENTEKYNDAIGQVFALEDELACLQL